MCKTTMLAQRQTLMLSRTTQLVPNTRAAAAPRATPHAAVKTRTPPELLSRIARGLLVGAAAFFLCLSVSTVRADETKGEHTWVNVGTMENDDPYADDDDIGSIDYFYDEKDPTNIMLLVHYKNGYEEQIYSKDKDASNPNPEDANSGRKGDLSSLIARAKQKGGKFFTDVDFWISPLGRHLSAGGNGPGPVINPSDDGIGPGGPRNPTIGKEKLGAPQIFNSFGQVGTGHGGFQFNGGSPADQLKTHGPGSPPGSTGSGDGDDKGSHKPPPGSNFGPAELVDPLGPPIARAVVKGTGNRITNIAGGIRRIVVVQGFGARPHYNLNNMTMRKRLGGPDTKAPKFGKISAITFHARRTTIKMSGPAMKFVRR
jgi:hypothetical protein